VDVEQADVRTVTERRLYRRPAVRDLRADDEAAALQRESHAGPRRGMVVGDQDGLGHGSTTSIFVPAFGRDAMCTSPPRACTRSVIVASPKPPESVPRIAGSNPEPSSETIRRIASPFSSCTRTRCAPP